MLIGKECLFENKRKKNKNAIGKFVVYYSKRSDTFVRMPLIYELLLSVTYLLSFVLSVRLQKTNVFILFLSSWLAWPPNICFISHFVSLFINDFYFILFNFLFSILLFWLKYLKALLLLDVIVIFFFLFLMSLMDIIKLFT